jgi:PIN domain nuclease of toxin-antitoxin system
LSAFPLRLLVDTRALLWWALDDPRLSRPAYAAIADSSNLVHVSAVSAFELATKHRLGKLATADALLADLDGYLKEQGFAPLPLDLPSAKRAGRLPGPHRDPFDRLLVAQAITADLALVSNATAFDVYGVRRLW